jgi:limonene 1,2-monooxygenase
VHGQTVDRRDWRVLMAWHLAESRDRAVAEAVHGLHRWHNEYNVHVLGRPGAERVEDPMELLAQATGTGTAAVGSEVVGTPDDMVVAIRSLYEITGGFGVLLGFAHDWASREATWRSWELFARYLILEINGLLRHQRASADYVAAASAAVMAKLMQHDGAARAMAVTQQQFAERRGHSRSGRDETRT